jgi:prophage DNA circulation protein
MTWRDNLVANSAGGQPLRGSFRAATFCVRVDDLAFGRRSQLHEYPLRDDPFVEDLGRRAREFQIEVFVAGDDFMIERDALIAAIEQPGPGTLVHPYYGTLTVSVVESRVRHSSRDGGLATFTLTCVESGELVFPTEVADTAARVEAAAAVARAATLADFVRRFSVDGLPGWTVTALEDELHRTLGDLTGAIGDVAGAIAAEIRAPFNMGNELIGAYQRVREIITEPLDALRLYQSLFDAGADSPGVPTTTATRRTQAQATDAMQRLAREAAVIEAADAAAAAEFASTDDALGARDALIDGFDARLATTDPVTGAPIANDVFDALRELRAAAIEDLHVRGARLPRITHYTPRATLPAAVIAYRLYGDAERAAEIVAHNKIRHPGFVPGGRRLEVLTDV